MLKFLREEQGATAIEYALIAAIISVVCITTVTFLGQKMSSEFNSIGTAISAN